MGGMIGEYLYRVSFNQAAFFVLITIFIVVLDDLFKLKKFLPKIELSVKNQNIYKEVSTQYANIKKTIMEKITPENSIQNQQDFLKQYMFTHCCFKDIHNSLWYLIPDVIKGCKVHLGDTRGIVPIKEAPPLELTPLSMITDEHAIELVKMKFNNDKGNVEDILTITIDKSFDEKGYQLSIEAVIKHNKWADFVERVFIGENIDSLYADYLRSKEYALSYNGISIDQMIEWKWLTLKTK